MDVTREQETKLAVPESFVLPRLVDLKGVDRVAARTLRLRAVHHDCEDLRLARQGTTLRHRTGEGTPTWTLKLGTVGTDGLDREELSVPGAATKVPTALVELLTARLRGDALHPVVTLKTVRSSTLLFDLDGAELAEVVDDRVEVTHAGKVTVVWRELEVEQRPGGRKAFERVVAALEEAGARVADQTPKAVRALGARAHGPADLPEPPTVGRHDPASALVSRALATGLRNVVRHDLGVRRGEADAVHQLRVSCRRLRSELRAFRPFLDDPRVEQLRTELSWLAGGIGAARDTEVLRERLRAVAGEDPLSPLDVTAVDQVLAALEATANDEALQVLRSASYVALLRLLHELASSGPVLSALASEPCKDALPALVDRDWRRLAKRTRALRLSSPDDQWHRARILAKRARYIAESAAQTLGKDPRAKAAKSIQTDLGLHQDAVVAAARYLALADEHPELAVTSARLAERERAHVVRIRKAFLRSSS